MIVDGRYEVIRELGRGSYGQVLEVRDHTMATRCALKLLSDDVLVGPWTESHLLRGLRGEYILPILNADVVAGRRYIVTEVMMGGTVDDHIQAAIGMPIDRAVRWAREACQGIARVHDYDLVHGDIKPGNLFLDAREEVLVGDFGLAQQVDDQGFAQAVGTPATMAPEVAASFKGKSSTPLTYTRLSDVYSLGATAYWMIAGQPPSVGTTDLVSGTRPDLWTVAPHAPRGLRDAINRAIALDPKQRQASASQLAAELGLHRSPDRTWNRTVPHSGHEQCYSGAKGESVIEVCVHPESTSRVRITGQHASSARRVRKAERTSSRRNLATALRSAFRACN
ncbi:serine/threonine-protein kinase [Brevibacterium renqingii]|uniref:serine/threonine-protein kinase n=1 Tax=Brevibacterium renqingii TaxID=2776916 RepID=UPI003457CE31